MAIFKVPRINTAQRETLVLEVGEIVYDIDQNTFFGGDNVSLGGFLIGAGAGGETERVQITEQHLEDGFLTLQKIPLEPDDVDLVPQGGIRQINGIDYIVEGNKIRWEGLGLDGFLETSDVLIIEY